MHPYRTVPVRPPLLWWQRVLLAVIPVEDLREWQWYRRHVGGRWFIYGRGSGIFAPHWVQAVDGDCPAAWHIFTDGEIASAGIFYRIDAIEQTRLALAHRERCTCEVWP